MVYSQSALLYLYLECFFIFKYNFGPIPWQAAEIIGGLLATESQSHRVTDTQGYPVYGWVKFCVPGFAKLPTRFARRGIRDNQNVILTLTKDVIFVVLSYRDSV